MSCAQCAATLDASGPACERAWCSAACHAAWMAARPGEAAKWIPVSALAPAHRAELESLLLGGM